MNNSVFLKSNPLYKVATGQNFAAEEIHFKPIMDVLELLYGSLSVGNFFINVIDFRDYTYPYNSPSVFQVTGYQPQDIANIEWLTGVIHPADYPIFMDYAVRVLTYVQALPLERKKRAMINHAFRMKHGITNEYIWIYQQHHMSYIDKNGAIVFSISLVTDITHLMQNQQRPTWSVVERHEDGRMEYLIGSEQEWPNQNFKKFSLSTREKQIINLSAKGLPSREIANRLNLGYETILSHRKNILRKTHSGNMAEAVSFAINLGYL